jgi:hypothetical protein
MKSKVFIMSCITTGLAAFSTYSANAQIPAGVQIRPIPFEKIDIITTQITPHFYVLTGSKGVDPGIRKQPVGGLVFSLDLTKFL